MNLQAELEADQIESTNLSLKNSTISLSLKNSRVHISIMHTSQSSNKSKKIVGYTVVYEYKSKSKKEWKSKSKTLCLW